MPEEIATKDVEMRRGLVVLKQVPAENKRETGTNLHRYPRPEVPERFCENQESDLRQC